MTHAERAKIEWLSRIHYFQPQLKTLNVELERWCLYILNILIFK
jgi:hypothetical protein